MLEDELGKPWQELYAELTPEPIAAASLGQVYKGRLKTGEQVAVKVQRPYVLEVRPAFKTGAGPVGCDLCSVCVHAAMLSECLTFELFLYRR